MATETNSYLNLYIYLIFLSKAANSSLTVMRDEVKRICATTRVKESNIPGNESTILQWNQCLTLSCRNKTGILITGLSWESETREQIQALINQWIHMIIILTFIFFQDYSRVWMATSQQHKVDNHPLAFSPKAVVYPWEYWNKVLVLVTGCSSWRQPAQIRKEMLESGNLFNFK